MDTHTVPHLRRALALSVAAGLVSLGQAQSGDLPRGWAESFGGSGNDWIQALAARSDGGLFLAGRTYSVGVLENFWVARLDRRGNTIWELSLGLADYDNAQALLATSDGGCLVAGTTRFLGSLGDAWIVKLESSGSIAWQKRYVSPDEDQIRALALSPDGYYAAGMVADTSGITDTWMLEIDDQGEILWQERFPTDGNEFVTSLATTDDGVALLSNTSADLPGSPGAGFYRPWLLHLDGDGNSQWQKTYDFSGGDQWNQVIALSDGGFCAAGEILGTAFFRGDAWVVRLDEDGDVLWDRRLGDHFGVPGFDGAVGVRQIGEGSFAVLAASDTASDGLWVIQLSANGTHQWDRSYGFGMPFENATAFDRAPNGDLFLAGTFFGSALDSHVLRLPPDGRPPMGCEIAHATDPNQWTSPLTVAPVTLAPVATKHTTASSSAVPIPMDTGRFLCTTPGG